MSALHDKPALANYYQKAIRKIFGFDTFVPKKYWPKFDVFMDDLRELHIPISDYAYTTADLLKAWTKDKHLKCLPVNIFLSDFALKTFLRVWKTETVELYTGDDYNVRMQHDELFVARAYIAANLKSYTRLSNIVHDCQQLISQEWIQLYKNHSDNRNKFTNKALEILRSEYRVKKDIESYDDIIAELIRWQNTRSNVRSA